jgi:hypothetical protein
MNERPPRAASRNREQQHATTEVLRVWTCAAALLASLLPCGFLMAGEESIKLIDAPGRDATMTGCATCHSLDYIPMNAPVMDRARWEKTLAKMVDKFGAPISQENAQAILDYLDRNYSGAGS